MKKLLSIGTIVGIVLCAWSLVAFAQLTSTGAGKKVTAASAYTGPGDIIASPTVWYGLRAFSTADRGNPLINVCNVADIACADLSSDATTGALVIATIGGSSCSVVVCTIKTFYDRSGNTKNATQATIADRPTLVVSCVNSLPCAAFSTQVLVSSAITAVVVPYSHSVVAIRTGTFTSFNTLATVGGTTNQIGLRNSANSAYIGNNTFNATAADSAWHAFQFVQATGAAASTINVDNTSTTGNSSPGTTGTFVTIGAFNAGKASPLIGNLTEYGLWPVAFSAGNMTSLCHNQFTYWGTATSC